MINGFKKQLGKTIRETRVNLGYSQQEIAKKLGLHRPTISQIEGGKREVSAEELTKLSELFGVPLSEIIKKSKGITEKKTPGTILGDIKVTFFRHGEATDDIYDQYGGWADPDLSPKGINNAYTIVRDLKERNSSFDIIYTSPLKRARQVAEIIGRELGVDIKVLQYLKERNTYGLLCGVNKSVAQKKFPDLVKAYESGKYVLGSEREEDFIGRLPLIFDYVRRSGYKNVCCITHGKVLTGIIKHLLKMKPDVLEDGCMLTVGLEVEKSYYIQSRGICFAK